MNGVDEEIIAETTALLLPSTSTPQKLSSPWYWPWQPSHWAAIPIIFTAGLSFGPSMILGAPLLKTLFCERGLPAHFPVQNNTNSLQSLSLQSFLSEPSNENGDRCDSAEYSAAIAKFLGIHVFLIAFFGDRIGRKKAMLVWSTGTTIGQTLPLLVYYNKNMSVYFLWLGGIIEGSAGGVLSIISLTHAYMADITRPEQRVVAFGQLMAGWHAGIGIGSALGGVLTKKFGLITAFWCMPTFIFIDLIYILLVPESLIISKNRESSRTLTTSQNQVTVPINSSDNSHTPKLNLPGRAEAIMNAFIPEKLPNTLGGKYSVMMLMIICFLALTGIMGATLQISPYLLYRFHFPSEKLGFVGAVQGLSRLAALSLLLPLVKRLAPQTSVSNPALTISFDLKVVVGGLLIEALSMFIYAVTPIGEGFYLGGVTGAVGSLFFPAIRGILSQAVASESLGKTLGTVAIFESVSSAFSPLIFAWIYVALSSAGLALAVLVAHRRDLHYRA
ncbi:hypothetical protein BGZ46_001963 [Entomortierella lignicola]|nr:hypothetical protein BGZ46_001963 [Entomortierella lignicola]